MGLEIESRIIATGAVYFPAPATPAFVPAPARHPGFIAAIVYNGVGDYTLTLSSETGSGGAIVRGNVMGPAAGFVQQGAAPPLTRAINILVFDDAGVPADLLIFTVTVEQMPVQA